MSGDGTLRGPAGDGTLRGHAVGPGGAVVTAETFTGGLQYFKKGQKHGHKERLGLAM